MTKSDSSNFYWMDWTRDLLEHPLEIEGAWIRICCKLHFSEDRGQMSKDASQWARILGISETRTLEILDYIRAESIGTVLGDLIKGNGKITVANRRMVREEKKRKDGAIRAERLRDRKKLEEQSRKSNTLFSIPIKDDEEEYIITQKDIQGWEEVFPKINVLQTLKRIRQWNIDNPQKRKTKHGIRRHIYQWLDKEQKPKPGNLFGDDFGTCPKCARSNIDLPVIIQGNHYCLDCGRTLKT